MSASPAPDAAGHRDVPDPVAVRWPWLTRNVAVLCGVSFLQDTASELLYPILPVFLTAVLGAPSPWSALRRAPLTVPPRWRRWPPGASPTAPGAGR